MSIFCQKNTLKHRNKAFSTLTCAVGFIAILCKRGHVYLFFSQLRYEPWSLDIRNKFVHIFSF